MSAPINPFEAMGSNISPVQSLVFAGVFAVLTLLIGFRMLKGSTPTFCYRVLALFGAVRIATFIVRYIVTRAHPTDSDYKTLLIVAGVLVVFGFLFYCEAILELLVVWYGAVRCADLTGMQRMIKKVRHLVLVGISVLGIVGTINEVNAVSNDDMSAYNTAKIMRQASGGLFGAVTVLTLLAIIVIACMGRVKHSRVSVARGATILTIMTLAMGVECAYRVWSATSSTGFVVKQTALDVLLIAPECIIIILFGVFSFEDGDVRFGFGTGGASQLQRVPQYSPESGYPLNQTAQVPLAPASQYPQYHQPYDTPYGQPSYGK
ncbi:uncharacterized protein LOC62_05G007615 [Vanrija pseudolonga]|uniref:Uncharacterized protein n=1 Tax=Vanrija pseudolonga TaxID=143232 RepID=A0AAF0YC89_9TREE|nr:hypothetical protein LOC62_05G007615 [Vanrija pseudolonga]